MSCPVTDLAHYRTLSYHEQLHCAYDVLFYLLIPLLGDSSIVVFDLGRVHKSFLHIPQNCMEHFGRNYRNHSVVEVHSRNMA